MEKDFNENVNYNPYYVNNGFDMNEMYKDSMFNPIAQYEQAYTYYKYLCMQMDYKIKCIEYENLCKVSKKDRVLILKKVPGPSFTSFINYF